MRGEQVQVLVVGAGPSGLAAAGLLAGYGVNVMALSKYSGPAPTPRSTVANARSMEVYRDMGIEEEMKAQGQSMQSTHFNFFATPLNGLEFSRYRSYGTSAERRSDYAAASPCLGWNIAQHRLAPVLLSSAKARGADVRYLHELVAIEQSEDRVTARVLERETGEEYIIHADYAIGADGGRSAVVGQIGFPIEGAPREFTIVSAWLEVDLTKYTAHRPAYLYNIFRPGPHQWFGAGSWFCVKPYHEWLFSVPSAGDTTEEELIARARETIGDPDVEIKVLLTYQWQVNKMYAAEFRKGRVFIAGDAAHRYPPSGGLGANTSVQDSFNLAWKLAYVLAGKAGDELLDSYHQERQPVGKHLVDRANRSLDNSAPIPKALGWTDDLPVEEGWRMLETLFEDTPEASARRAALCTAVDPGNYRSNAIGMELGQRYASCAIIDDGTPFPEPKRDPELFYEPSTHPGAYLPHSWIDHQGREISTLDAVGKGELCLLVGIDGAAWARAAEAIGRDLGVDLAVRFVGLGCDYNDLTGEWASVREVGDHGALLVRPDRWIAWRAMTLPDDPEGALRDALIQLLALPVPVASDLETCST